MEDLNFVLYMQRKFSFLHSVPGLFVPHPASSGGASKRGNKLPSSDSVSNNQLNVTRPSDQSVLIAVAPDPWHPIATPITGKKRPPEGWEPLTANQYSYLNSGHGFDQEGCPSPPMPSMSSALQALLSKLPNVTLPLDNMNNGCSYASNASFEVIHSGRFNSDFNSNQLPAMSSDSSHLQRMVGGPECRMTSPTNYSSVGNHVGEDVDFQPQSNYRSVVIAKENHGNNSMLDSYDNFTEFGIQEALESGDSSYSSFLNEICS
jgi:hypothetical protein